MIIKLNVGDSHVYVNSDQIVSFHTEAGLNDITVIEMSNKRTYWARITPEKLEQMINDDYTGTDRTDR